MPESKPPQDINARIAGLMAEKHAGEPTWAEYALRRHEEVQEMGAALDHDYPYFLAVLSPERTFLHYLISGIICNACIDDPDALKTAVNDLCKPNVAAVIDKYKEQADRIEAEKQHFLKLADSFFDKRIGGYEQTLEDVLRTESNFLDSLTTFSRSLKPTGVSLNPHAVGDKLFEQFENIYKCIDYNMSNKHVSYVPGCIDTINLTQFKKVFMAVCEDRFMEEQIKNVVKPQADRLIAEAIKAGTLKALPDKREEDCRNIVIAGITAAGKTRLLSAIEKKAPEQTTDADRELFTKLRMKEPITRSKSVMIDIDEFRDVDSILETSHIKKSNPNWGTLVHEECHMIRRKIMDELEEQHRKGVHHDVILMTAHLSDRIRHWLTKGNKPAEVYFLYCDPVTALRNAETRAERDGGYKLPKKTVLNSFRNLAQSIRYLFNIETAAESNMTVHMLDTSGVDLNRSPQAGSNGMGNIKTIMTADNENGVQIHDFDKFWNVHCGHYIKSNVPTHLKPGGDMDKIFKLDKNEQTLHELVRANLRPHNVMFRSVKSPGEIVAVKKQGDDFLEGSRHALFAESGVLASIYKSIEASISNLLPKRIADRINSAGQGGGTGTPR